MIVTVQGRNAQTEAHGRLVRLVDSARGVKDPGNPIRSIARGHETMSDPTSIPSLLTGRI